MFKEVRFWQEYVEPVESSMHVENSTNRLEIDPVLLPPEQGVLDYNCGATIIVAITKSDLNMEVGADIDKVQYHVRQFCIQHGATLVRVVLYLIKLFFFDIKCFRFILRQKKKKIRNYYINI